MVKLGEQDENEYTYEVMNVPPQTSTSFVKTEDETYYSIPHFHPPLPDIPLTVAPPTGGDAGVAREGKEENVYYNAVSM